jgi:hypothetical protein
VEGLVGREVEEARVGTSGVEVGAGELGVPSVGVVADELQVGFCADGG